MDDNTMVSEVEANTGVSQETVTQEAQVNGKTFTQDELNAIVAKRIAAEQKKFDGIDMNEYRELKAQKEKQETDRLMKREEFDKLLKQTKERFDTETITLRSELHKVKIDGALLNAASKNKAVNPEHVAQLLKNNVKLDETGNPVVLNGDGEVRYNTDTAEPYTIDELVNEFLSSNPYFMPGGPSGTGSQSNTQTQSSKSMDLSQLDLTRPDHRQLYKKMKMEGKL
jgi:hypothetical protein